MATGLSDCHKKRRKQSVETTQEKATDALLQCKDESMNPDQSFGRNEKAHAQQTLTTLHALDTSDTGSHCKQSKNSGTLTQRRSTNVTCSHTSYSTNGHITDGAHSKASRQNVSHQNGSRLTKLHESGVVSWLKWLDEPEFMIPEGHCIHQSTNSDSVLAEINASLV
jgi:hypothetical protein